MAAATFPGTRPTCKYDVGFIQFGNCDSGIGSLHGTYYQGVKSENLPIY
jgi:hypothetical protein